MSRMNNQADKADVDPFTEIVKKFDEHKQISAKFDDDKKHASEILDKKHASELLDNQRAMVAYARHVNSDTDKNMRGFILFHGMGTGKTITSLRCAYEMLTGRRKKLFLIIPASLHNAPWMQTLTYGIAKHKNLQHLQNKDMKQKLIDENIFFIHHNANNISKRIFDIGVELKSGNENIFNDSVVIIDEIHDFINTLVNTKSETNAKLLMYNQLMSANNMKIISNTGTPFVNTPFEMTYLINLHRGWEMFETGESKREAFLKTFFHKGNLYNAARLHSGFYRIVSYFRSNTQNMPRCVYKDVQFLRYNNLQIMTNNYFVSERADREQAREDKMGPTISIHTWTERMKRAEALNARGSLRTALNYGRIREEEMVGSEDYTQHDYLIGPRMISNFVLPPQFGKYFNDHAPFMIPQETNMRMVIDRLAKNEIADVDGQQFKTSIIRNLDAYSPKIARILQIVKGQPGPFMIYSNFKNYGVYPIAAILTILGYEEYTGKTSPDNLEPKNRFIIFSGSVDTDVRTKLLKAYNKDNYNGDKIRFILITSSGKQGISLEKTRKVFIMEPFWSNQLIEQVEARAIRVNSHRGLPEAEQEVEIYKFIMVGSDSPELLLAQISLNKSININLVKRLMMRSAIDCLYHYEINFRDDKDTQCVPTRAVKSPQFGERVVYDQNAEDAFMERVTSKKVVYIKRSGMLYHDMPGVEIEDINVEMLKIYKRT